MAVATTANRTCPEHGNRWIDEVTLKCTKCVHYNETHGGRCKAQPRKEAYESGATEQYTFVGKFDPEDFRRWLDRIEQDPIRFAAFMANARRPAGVSKAAYGVAIRRAAREPMLAANPESIRDGLIKVKGPLKGALPKNQIFKRILVKPVHFKVAGKAGGWHSREWIVYTLKYTSGLVIVTEKGDESRVYRGWGQMKRDIEQSGWEIIR